MASLAQCLADTLQLSKSGRFESNDLIELKSRLEAGVNVVYAAWDDRQPTTADEKTITGFLATFFFSFDSMLDLGVVKLIESHAELLLWLLSHSYACKVAVSQQLQTPLLTKLVNAFRGHIASLSTVTEDTVSQQLSLLLTLASEAQFANQLVEDGMFGLCQDVVASGNSLYVASALYGLQLLAHFNLDSRRTLFDDLRTTITKAGYGTTLSLYETGLYQLVAESSVWQCQTCVQEMGIVLDGYVSWTFLQGNHGAQLNTSHVPMPGIVTASATAAQVEGALYGSTAAAAAAFANKGSEQTTVTTTTAGTAADYSNYDYSLYGYYDAAGQFVYYNADGTPITPEQLAAQQAAAAAAVTTTTATSTTAATSKAKDTKPAVKSGRRFMFGSSADRKSKKPKPKPKAAVSSTPSGLDVLGLNNPKPESLSKTETDVPTGPSMSLLQFVTQVGKTEGDPEPAILSDAQLATLQARGRSLSVADLGDTLERAQEDLVFEAIAVLTGSLLKSGRVDGFLNPQRIEQHAALLLAILTSSPALAPVLQEVSRDAKCLELFVAAAGNGPVPVESAWQLVLLVAEQRKGFPLVLKLISPVVKAVFAGLQYCSAATLQAAFALLSRLAHADEKFRRSFIGQLVAVVTTSPPAGSMQALLKAQVMTPTGADNRLGTCQRCHAELVAKLGAFCPPALAEYTATGKDDDTHVSSAPLLEATPDTTTPTTLEQNLTNGSTPAPAPRKSRDSNDSPVVQQTVNPGFTAIGSRTGDNPDKDDGEDKDNADNAEEESDMELSDDEDASVSIPTPTTLKGLIRTFVKQYSSANVPKKALQELCARLGDTPAEQTTADLTALTSLLVAKFSKADLEHSTQLSLLTLALVHLLNRTAEARELVLTSLSGSTKAVSQLMKSVKAFFKRMTTRSSEPLKPPLALLLALLETQRLIRAQLDADIYTLAMANTDHKEADLAASCGRLVRLFEHFDGERRLQLYRAIKLCLLRKLQGMPLAELQQLPEHKLYSTFDPTVKLPCARCFFELKDVLGPMLPDSYEALAGTTTLNTSHAPVPNLSIGQSVREFMDQVAPIAPYAPPATQPQIPPPSASIPPPPPPDVPPPPPQSNPDPTQGSVWVAPTSAKRGSDVARTTDEKGDATNDNQGSASTSGQTAAKAPKMGYDLDAATVASQAVTWLKAVGLLTRPYMTLAEAEPKGPGQHEYAYSCDLTQDHPLAPLGKHASVQLHATATALKVELFVPKTRTQQLEGEFAGVLRNAQLLALPFATLAEDDATGVAKVYAWQRKFKGQKVEGLQAPDGWQVDWLFDLNDDAECEVRLTIRSLLC
eukprot:m.173532 g.173532  ORF g.173532 m.173532 type:complete len:1323 (+) comp16740_c0_seq1:39-4007(+)